MKKCIFLRFRQKNYKIYRYCCKLGEKVYFQKCNKCEYKEYLFRNSIKRKSKKLRKLEKNRKSILTDNLKVCYICGKKSDSIHEIFKGSNRKMSMINNFCVPLCENCHRNTEINIELLRYLQRVCQSEYEKNHSREQFMNLTGKNFL